LCIESMNAENVYAINMQGKFATTPDPTKGPELNDSIKES